MDTSSWKPININKIFDISYGNKLDMCKMTPDEDGIPFITRTATNNGVGGMVEPVEGVTPYPAGSLSIALGGSIGSTFLQTKDFYTSQNVAVLQPKSNLDSGILLFLARLIEKECSKRFVAFGRELNKHIKRDFTIKLPLIEKDKPNWPLIASIVKDQIIPQLPKKAQKVWLQKYDIKPQKQKEMKLNTDDWKWFNYSDLFAISGSKTTKIEELETYGKGEYPYVTTQAVNNGVENFYNFCTEKGGVLTVDSAVLGFCSYQEKDFSASDHVEVLTPKFEMNRYIALFLTTLINREQYRYSYGRKCSQVKLRSSKIKLPVTPSSEPDWQFMEDYIKSLPYSKNLEPSDPKEVVDELVEMKKEVIKMRRAMEAQQSAHLTVHIDTYNDNSKTYNVEK